MLCVLSLMVAAASPCGDSMTGLQSLASSNLRPAELRDQATAVLNSAHSVISSSFPDSRIALEPIFRGFARRIAEISDGDLPVEVADVAASLAEVCRRAGAPSSAKGAELDRRRLQEILARPEFDLQDEPMGLLDRVWRWLRKVVLSLLEARGTATYGEAGRYVILILGAAGAVFVAYRIIRARRPRISQQPSQMPQPSRSLDTPETHLGRSLDAQARGDHRGSMREEMLAVLATLERLHFAQRGRAQTNREIASQAEQRGASPETAERLKDLADRYDRAWYGLAEVSAADCRDFSTRAQGVRFGAERTQ